MDGIPISRPESEAASRVLTERVVVEVVRNVVVDLKVGFRVLLAFEILVDEVASFPLFEGTLVL